VQLRDCNLTQKFAPGHDGDDDEEEEEDVKFSDDDDDDA
jgi:hypothetical protein